MREVARRQPCSETENCTNPRGHAPIQIVPSPWILIRGMKILIDLLSTDKKAHDVPERVERKRGGHEPSDNGTVMKVCPVHRVENLTDDEREENINKADSHTSVIALGCDLPSCEATSTLKRR